MREVMYNTSMYTFYTRIFLIVSNGFDSYRDTPIPPKFIF